MGREVNMNLKSMGYYILVLSLLFIAGVGIFTLYREILLSEEIGLIVKVPLVGIITGILVLLAALIKERINERND